MLTGNTDTGRHPRGPAMSDNPLRDLPSVNDVLLCHAVRDLEGRHAHEQVVAAVRAELAEARERLKAGQPLDGEAAAQALAAPAVAPLAHTFRPKLRTA